MLSPNIPAPILEFQGPYRWLSNFWPAVVVHEGLMFGSAEAAFQAAKAHHVVERQHFQALSPSAAKALGRRIVLRPDWEQVKIGVMLTVVRDKFYRSPELAALLCATGWSWLEEGNTWGDRQWGVCPPRSGDGQNWLGKILMQVRLELRG